MSKLRQKRVNPVKITGFVAKNCNSCWTGILTVPNNTANLKILESRPEDALVKLVLTVVTIDWNKPID